jgi:hypothetical protein
MTLSSKGSGSTPHPRPDQVIEMPEKFHKAVMVAMELFNDFIVYEVDAPEEARIMLFPAYMHIKQEDIDRQIKVQYNMLAQGDDAAFHGSEVDRQIILWGVLDSISILRKRTNNSFPQGQTPLTAEQFKALSELAAVETRLFYRLSESDCMRRYIPVCEKYSIRANQPPGSRIRHWITVEMMAKLFFTILIDDSIEDKIAAMIEQDEANKIGHAMWFMRWREAELI